MSIADPYRNPAETGFYYLNSRYYDPVVGRFINADKPEVLMISFEGIVDKNLYAYCNNNPVIFKDKTGEIPVIAVKMIVGAAVNVASEWVSASMSGEKLTVKDVVYTVVEGAALAVVPGKWSILAAGVAGAIRSKVVENNEGHEVFRDGVLAGLGSYYSVVGKVDKKFVDGDFWTKNIQKAYEVLRGLFEYTENISVVVLTGILNSRTTTSISKPKQNPGKCHTRTWYKEREM